MRTATQRSADVPGEAANVGAATALHRNAEFVFPKHVEPQVMNGHGSFGQFELFPRSRGRIGALPGDLDSADKRVAVATPRR